MMPEAETEVQQLEAKECQAWLAVTGSWNRPGRVVLNKFLKEQGRAHTWMSDF